MKVDFDSLYSITIGSFTLRNIQQLLIESIELLEESNTR